MTPAATEFVGAVTFEALTGRPVHTGLFDPGRRAGSHQAGARGDAIVVAPATADFLARAATGQADDLLTACLLAATCPVLLVPAMNDHMWAHPQTQRNVAHLRELGYQVVDPDDGMLAAGEGSGPGRMPEPETIFAHVGRLLERDTRAARASACSSPRARRAKRSIRFASSRITAAARWASRSRPPRGGVARASTSSPARCRIAPPTGVARARRSNRPSEMARRGRRAAPGRGRAGDGRRAGGFPPGASRGSKIKKASAPESIALAPTPDILCDDEACAARRRGRRRLRARDERRRRERAREARGEGSRPDRRQRCDRSRAPGFGVDTNRVTLLSRDGDGGAPPADAEDRRRRRHSRPRGES